MTGLGSRWGTVKLQQGHTEVPGVQIGVIGILVQDTLAFKFTKPESIDFSLWDYVAKKTQTIYRRSVDSLKAAVDAAWSAMPAAVIKKLCSRFQARIEALVAAEG